MYVQRALHYQRELRKQLEETHRAQEAAYRDPMTSLHNFRYLQAYIGKKVNLGKTFAAMMIDLDHFKSVNDTYGHQVGDEVLRQVGNVLRDHVQGRDAAVRYGGEEFSVVLLDISPEDAKAKAETIRQAIADRAIPRPGGEVRVTASIGVAMYPLDGQTPEAVYKVADHRLYMAKENGRNRVVGRPKEKDAGKLAG
ncbi:MAG: GGDEF domain-containing protein [Bacillota bacterium]